MKGKGLRKFSHFRYLIDLPWETNVLEVLKRLGLGSRTLGLTLS